MRIYLLHLPHFVALARVAMCLGLLALTIGCGDKKASPVSPDSTPVPGPDANADGSTLKATTPTIVSPSGGVQATDPLTFVAGKSNGKFKDITPSYQFQVRSGSAVIYDSGTVGGVGAGNNVTFSPGANNIQPDTDYTWRARAVLGNAVGSWSADGSFKSPVGAYIRGNEVRDPLTIGRTVGTPFGSVQFVANGLALLTHESRVGYQLPVTLEAGEFSLMVTGFDEGSPGDKSKIMSMQEGFGDITTNDYRFTAEKRGSSYVTPGAVTFRMINGEGGEEDFINDGFRTAVPFSDERWYFWKITWSANSGSLEVREDSPTGRVIYFDSVSTNGHAYRPQPHVIWLGAPVGRAGPIDASIPGTIYKNVWIGPGPRPKFPGE
jgi:hypothetical protein